MSESVGRDAPGASDKAVGARPATKRAVRADRHQQLPVYSQNEDPCKGTEWNNRRGRSLADFSQ